MSGSNSPGNTSNSPTGDTGLNFVLQNATSGGGSGTEQDGQQQFTGLATLNKLLQQQPESEQQQQPQQQEEQTENETQNDRNNDDDSANQQQQEQPSTEAEPTNTNETVETNHTPEEALAATAVPSAEEHQQQQNKEQEERREEDQQQQEKKETQNDDTKTEEETNSNNNNNNIVRLDIGTGSYEDGHFHFQTSRAATGEALHRVFHFSNRTTATATSLVPQIAPHLAQGGNNAYRHRLGSAKNHHHDDMLDDSSSSHGKTAHSNKKLEKLVQLQREHEDKYKSYNAATSSSSTGENTNKEGGGNKEEGGAAADTGHYSGYRPYSLRSPLGAHHQHMSPEQNNTPDGVAATASTSTSAQHHHQHQNHHSPRHHNFVGFSRDLFGLHCLFDACKDLISEKPKKLPKLRISGVQREVDDVSNSKAAAAGGSTTSGSTEEQQQQQSGGSNNETGAETEQSTTDNNNNNNTGKTSHLSISQIQKQKRILHHHVSSNQHQTTRDQLISWLTPWPFEIEATADKNTASKFNQQQMDRFNPISPIFTEPAISPNSIAFQLAVSVRVAAQEEERQRELLQQQQEAQEEAHRLAQALAQQHGEEGDNTNNNDAAENEEDEKKETASATSAGGKQQQTANTKKSSSNANTGGGFLPRGFQVSSIPSVLPSLLTVTSARNPAGIHQQEQDNNNNNSKKGENVDWSSSSPGQHQPHPPNQSQQQVKILGENTSGRKTLTGGENSARMRNRAKLWSTTLSSVGMLIPSELTHSMKFEKHKDVKQLENKTEKLRHELEHFKTMRRIRSGQNSSDHHQSSSASARDNFRSHMWQTNQKSTTSTTARNSSSSGKANAEMNNTRPATPPRSFLASHGLRSAQQQQQGAGGDHHHHQNQHHAGGTGGVHLPPIHGHNNNNNNISGKDGGGMIATTVMNHPPVPWSRQIATGSSNLSARFTVGKYERPERANLVAALMD